MTQTEPRARLVHERFTNNTGDLSDIDAIVSDSIARIKTSSFIPREDQIRGFVYDVYSGALREVT